MIEWVEEGKKKSILEWRLLLKSGGDRQEGVEEYLRRMWEQKVFFKDGQDLDMFVAEKGSVREGEMEGLEERAEWQMEQDPEQGKETT